MIIYNTKLRTTKVSDSEAESLLEDIDGFFKLHYYWSVITRVTMICSNLQMIYKIIFANAKSFKEHNLIYFLYKIKNVRIKILIS